MMVATFARILILSKLTEFISAQGCVYIRGIKPSFSIPDFEPVCVGVCPPEICKRKFVVYYSAIEPYNGPIKKILNETIGHCCWNRKYFIPELKFIHTSNISSVIEKNAKEENSDLAPFIFPVLGHQNSKRLHGHFFVPLIEPPNAFYVTPKHKVDVDKLILNCFELWPLLVMCVVLAAIAGFIAWLFETRNNKEEFPRPFIRGSCN